MKLVRDFSDSSIEEFAVIDKHKKLMKILTSGLSQNAKFIYCCIDSVGGIFSEYSISTFSREFKATKAYIRAGIKELKDKNIISIKKSDKSDLAIEMLLISKNMKGKGIWQRVCEWCHCNTFILHEHHYPIARKDGGEETVGICPSCHFEFHFLQTSYIIEIND